MERENDSLSVFESIENFVDVPEEVSEVHGNRLYTNKKLAEKTNEYFRIMVNSKHIPDVGTYAMFLGVDDSTTVEWEKEGHDLSPTVKRAKAIIYAWKRDGLTNNNGNVTGLIFDLKNNYGWTDKQEITQEVTTKQIEIIENKEETETFKLDD